MMVGLIASIIEGRCFTKSVVSTISGGNIHPARKVKNNIKKIKKRSVASFLGTRLDSRNKTVGLAALVIINAINKERKRLRMYQSKIRKIINKTVNTIVLAETSTR